MTGQFIGVGVGPGDPELITLKAARYIANANVISFIANEQGESVGKDIAQSLLNKTAVKDELPVTINMFAGRDQANENYDAAASEIKKLVEAGKTVVFLCEGDPLFFGSFGYLLERLEPIIPCLVVPGISSVHAAGAVLKQPLTMLRESFAVVSGRHGKEKLVEVLNSHDTVVIMKAGRQRQTILDALASSGRTKETQYLENISRENEFVERDITKLEDDSGPYFSLFVVTRAQRDRS